ncbi:alpha/beta fold hydrolase [Tateyamaria sp.]|uniref:alpha/beta fold hydrolase n=1 Tax=Tateyamaria sp. TaxID=1929288 RepID=UPI00329F8960
MIWVVVLALGLIAIPQTIEWMRHGVNAKRRADSPGKVKLLSQGETYYEWLGPERGPVAVCVHGLSTSSYVWHGMAKGLALLGFRVLVYDHYGRGLSEAVSGKQDADFFVTQLVDLLVLEKIDEPLTMLGYSMGGAVVAHFAARYPGKVKQLILLAPAGMHDIAGGKIKMTRDWPVIGDWLFLLIYPFILRKGIRAEAGLPSSVEDINALQHAETDRRGYFPAILSSLRGLLRHKTKEQHLAIAAMGLPVLAIWGEDDDVIPLSSKDALAEWHPQAQQTVIPGAGHGLTHTHTDQVLDAIKASRG